MNAYDCNMSLFSHPGHNPDSKIIIAKTPIDAAVEYLNQLQFDSKSSKEIGNNCFELRVFPRHSAFIIGGSK